MAQDYPSNSPISNDDGTPTNPWNQWFQRVQNVVTAAYSSGPTTSRPTKLLWVGRSFYDLTLGRPVWVYSVNPTVWKDAFGAIV
jgi:hypothetical protein